MKREQAGSDSYNRFEYQVHRIVCHNMTELSNRIIGKLQNMTDEEFERLELIELIEEE